MAHVLFPDEILKMFGLLWHWPDWTSCHSLQEWVEVTYALQMHVLVDRCTD